jgi:alpha-tubulin suppressor-like RCC1 family protein
MNLTRSEFMRTSNFPSSLIGCLVSSTAAFGVVADPVLSPSPGVSDAKFDLTITCATPGAVIRYTLNGSEPTPYDPTYSGVIPINRDWTVKAKAWVGTETSNTVTGTYQMSGSVSGGAAHSMALKSSGAVFAWGHQQYGRLGNNATADGSITSPVASRYSSGVIGDGSLIAAGFDHSVLLQKGGWVWAYGRNDFGQIGINNSTLQSGYARRVTTNSAGNTYLTGCVSVAAGTQFGAAVQGTAGEVYTWGSQATGRLGNGQTGAAVRYYGGKVYKGTSGTTPLTGIARVVAGGASGFGLATATGKVWAWGANSSGQLGQGSTTTLPWAAVVKLNATTDLTDVTELSAGESHLAVVRWKAGDPNLQGVVYCVGQQSNGRLGNGATVSASITYPVQVLKAAATPLDNIVEVAAGCAHTLALDTNGNVWAWGRNAQGAVGDNTTIDRSMAVQVKNPAGTAPLSNIVRIAAGGTALLGHSLAVAADGTVYAWGYNVKGQLGNSSTSNAIKPVVVSGPLDLLPTLPNVSLVCSVSPSGYSNSAVLTAAPQPGSSTVSTVDFFVDGTFKAQASAPLWTATVTPLSSGSHHVYAMATDSAGLKAQSPCADFTLSSDPNAANLDTDGDGVIDSTEVTLGTSVTDADTDGDGIPDGTDPLPLIPSTVPLAAASTLMVWSPLE